jgi:hypothetical protein
VGLYPESRGEGSYALEVAVSDLPFQPDSSEVSRTADVTVTAADRKQHTLSVSLVSDSVCWEGQGSFYFEDEWDSDFAALGQDPFEIEVMFTMMGTTYTGTGTWSRGVADGTSGEGYVPLVFTPPLPTLD